MGCEVNKDGEIGWQGIEALELFTNGDLADFKFEKGREEDVNNADHDTLNDPFSDVKESDEETDIEYSVTDIP
ncbi:hypothetical protein NPIL_3321 [Nephila pilipes]|uniref:Uncharacterized protein n=1 Tax=Nephila pilipes TaxID=299642 RepID=A0A8X6NJB5_NEPPI|nr:hypothetical protein NPIL_3321 [Nephila pilipes]